MRIPYQACPLCQSSKIAPLMRDEFHVRYGNCRTDPLYHSSMSELILWMRCLGCAHVFTSGYWDAESCKLIFATTQETHKVGYGLNEMRLGAARIVEKVSFLLGIQPHSPVPLSWIDVGFGNGALALTAQEFGFATVGYDVREENCRALREYGLKAECADICGDAAFLAACTDVISMTEVIEHLPFPARALRTIHGMLRAHGALVLSTPNMSGALWKHWERTETNPFWDELEHYHIFSRERLYSLLLETGFLVTRYGVSERYPGCMELIAMRQ